MISPDSSYSSDSMKQAYLISSNPLESLDSLKEAYLISSDPSDSLDSVKVVTGIQTCHPVILEVPSSGWGITVEQLRTVLETLKTKTTRASEILAVFTKLHGVTSQKTGT